MDSICISSPQFADKASCLTGYGYALERVLNKQNRRHIKIVCSLVDRGGDYRVSTTYKNTRDYLRLLETATLLKRNRKLAPPIVNLYPEINTVVCDYMGEFLQDYLLRGTEGIRLLMRAVFEYFPDINSINLCRKSFTIPSIIKSAAELSRTLKNDSDFLGRSGIVLSGGGRRGGSCRIYRCNQKTDKESFNGSRSVSDHVLSLFLYRKGYQVYRKGCAEMSCLQTVRFLPALLLLVFLFKIV